MTRLRFKKYLYFRVQNATTPLWKLTYEEQLAKKRDEVLSILKKFGSNIEKTNRDLRSWFKLQR